MIDIQNFSSYLVPLFLSPFISSSLPCFLLPYLYSHPPFFSSLSLFLLFTKAIQLPVNTTRHFLSLVPDLYSTAIVPKVERSELQIIRPRKRKKNTFSLYCFLRFVFVLSLFLSIYFFPACLSVYLCS